MGDCGGRSPGLRLKRLFQAFPVPAKRHQWRNWKRLAAYSCGSSLGSNAFARRLGILPVFPFHRRRAEARYRTVTIRMSTATREEVKKKGRSPLNLVYAGTETLPE